MTTRPHDAIFKAAFEDAEHAAGLVQRVLPADLVAAIDWNSMTRLSGSYIDPDLADRHTDLLFTVNVGGIEARLYVIVEHQSSNDRDMPLRLLIYLARIWELFRRENKGVSLPPIIPVVISHAPGGWTAPTRFQDMMRPYPPEVPGLSAFVPDFTMAVEDLAHLSNDDLKATALAAFPKLVLWALRDARDRERVFENLAAWASTFAEALQSPHGLEAVAQLMKYFAHITDDVQPEQLRAKIRPLVPEAEEIAVTIAEQMRQEGLAQGLAQGRVETILKLLALKFGELSEDHRARVTKASPDELDRFIERVMTEGTLEAVLAPQ